MRSSRRKITTRHQRSVPQQSRLTVPRAVAALRRGREALSDIQGQLDDLLVKLRENQPRLEASAPDRLAGARERAQEALRDLAELGPFLP